MPVKAHPLTCRCGNVFGYGLTTDEVFIGAQIGSLVVDESMHGKCAKCGRGIHLVVNRKAYLRLMRHYSEVDPLMIEISDSDE